MKELERHESRLDVVENLGGIIQKHGFTPSLVGGIYALQGHLSMLIAESLVYSLGKLIIIFAFIAFVFGRSLRISLAMTMSISIIPLCVLGVIGYFKVPLDTIAAPATNVAIGIGIDSMIHMVNIFHRSKHITSNAARWDHVTRQMWQPVITSTLIICAGFGIFFFSSFPPTQRFGETIVLGSIVAAISSLFIFPLLAKRK
jgi:predicted RND superfamily exporter protein